MLEALVLTDKSALLVKNQPTKMNDILTANKSSNSFYVHKNLKYKIPINFE